MLLGYVRCSTLEQLKGSSPDTQRRVIQGLAMAKGVGAYDLQIFEDRGVSGAIALKERPAGSELWKAAQRGDIIVASKLDRLFRDALDAQQSYHDLKKRGVDLILFDMGTESVMSGGLSKLFFMLLSEFAELERMRIAERMQEGRNAKKRRGGHTGGPPPYGFRVVGAGREALLEPVEEEQKVLEVIRENSHLKVGGIRRVLRSRNLHNRQGKVWHRVELHRILAREARA